VVLGATVAVSGLALGAISFFKAYSAPSLPEQADPALVAQV